MSQKTATEFFDEGIAHRLKGNYAEALASFEQAVTVQPDYSRAYGSQAFCLRNLGRLDEAVNALNKAIQYDSAVHNYVNKALILEQLKKYDEALESFDDAISKNPASADVHFEKGNLLNRLGKRPEALECYKEAVRVRPEYDKGHHNIGSVYYSMKSYNDAIKHYNEAIRLNPDNALSHCWRGNCYLALGQKEDSRRDFLKAQELLESEQAARMYSPDNLKYMNEKLKSVLELDDMIAKTRNIVMNLKTTNPFFQRIAANLKAIEEAEAKSAKALLKPQEKRNPAKGAVINDQIEQLRKENEELKRLFNERLSNLEKSQEKMHAKVESIDHKVEEIDDKVERIAVKVDEIENELSLKMVDYNRKMTVEVGKLALSDDDKNKLKQYFNAFVSTFSSAYATAQVVDSEQVSLDSGTAVTSALSFMTSFIPFIDSYLEMAVSVLEFMETREIKMNARKMKGLANSADHLSQIIGSTALQVLLEPTKRSEILGITEADVKGHPRNYLDKILALCDRVSEKIDAMLYTRLYNAPAAFWGQKDANRLIETWTKGLPETTNIEEKFKELAIKGDQEENNPVTTTPGATSPGTAEKQEAMKKQVGNRKACCSMF